MITFISGGPTFKDLPVVQMVSEVLLRLKGPMVGVVQHYQLSAITTLGGSLEDRVHKAAQARPKVNSIVYKSCPSFQGLLSQPSSTNQEIPIFVASQNVGDCQ